MKIKDLKKIINDIPDDLEVYAFDKKVESYGVWNIDMVNNIQKQFRLSNFETDNNAREKIKNNIMENKVEIGVDINNRKIFTGDRVKRDDGVIGRFNLLDFELCFDYEEEQEDGAICSYINHLRKYELL